MEKTVEYDIIRDKDLKGLSIGIIESFIIEGERVSKPTRRRAFRKFNTDEQGNEIENENFEAEIDEWTGVEDFIKTRYNF